MDIMWSQTAASGVYGYHITRANNSLGTYEDVDDVVGAGVTSYVDPSGTPTNWYKIYTRYDNAGGPLESSGKAQTFSASIVNQYGVQVYQDYISSGGTVDISIGTYVIGSISIKLLKGATVVSTWNIETDEVGSYSGQILITAPDGDYTISAYDGDTLLGSDSLSVSRYMVGILDTLNDLLFEFQHIHVSNESVVEMNTGGSLFKFAFKNWGIDTPPQFFVDNGIILTSKNYIDYNNGIVGVSGIPYGSSVTADYTFRYFTDESLSKFISQSLNEINIKKPYTDFALGTTPGPWDAPILYGAYRLALRRILQGLMFRDTQLILAGDNAIPLVQTLYTQVNVDFQAMVKETKRRGLVSPNVIASGKYRVPGRVTGTNWRQYAGIMT